MIISLLVFFMLLELTVRVLDMTPAYGYPDNMYQKDNLLDYRLTPNQEGFVVKQEFKTHFHTNSKGMHDIEYEEKKKEDYRILALGDSFTWGAYGTELNKTYLKILETKMNQNSKEINFQVMNAGVPGYGPDQEYLYLKHYGSELEPNMILLNFYVNNDFQDSVTMNEMTVNEKGQLITKKTVTTRLEKSRNFMLKNSHAYRLLEGGAINLFSKFIGKNIVARITNWEGIKDLYLVQPTSKIDKQVTATLKFLKEMKDYAQKNNLDFVVVIIPAKYQVDNHLQKDFIKENKLIEGEYELEKPQKIITKWGKTNKIKIIDLLPVLKEKTIDNDFYWRLNPHFNQKGNKEVAKIIYDKLVTEEWFIDKLAKNNDKQEIIALFEWKFMKN